MTKTIKIINLSVFCIWAVLISILLYKNYKGDSLERIEGLSEAFSKNTYWYDIYVGTKKAGFSKTDFEKAGDEIIIKYELQVKVKKNEKETVLFEKLKCLTTMNYAIKSFEYTSNFKDEKGIKVSGEADKDGILFFLGSADKRTTHQLSTDGNDFYLPITLIPVIYQKNPTPNTPFLIKMLDIINFSINDVQVVLEEIKPIKVGINILSLYKFRVGDSIFWINEKGIVVKQKLSTGLTFYAETEYIAKDPADRVVFDYTSLPYFKSKQAIADPEKLTSLKLKVTGFSLDQRLYKSSLVNIKNNILTIKKEELEDIKKKTYTLPYKKDGLHSYLAPDRWVLSDYKPLQNTGRIYAESNNNDALQLTSYLTSYLYNLLRTMPVFAVSDSKDILKSLSGNYLERSVMYASYTRAAGLPTRLVSGLVYRNGYFYFHAWPEVWFDKWIPVDPAFYQFPADVTHIPLKEGRLDEIISIIDDLKGIEIEILETS